MASILKVDTIQDQTGNNIINENANVITIGASGDTITIPSGASMSGFSSTGIDDNATSTAITIDSSENVGIGTTNPTAPLHIDTNTADANNPFVNFDNDDGNIGQIRMSSSGDFGFRANTGGTGVMFFQTGGSTERMRIDSSGNVGIGNTVASTINSANGTGNLVVGSGSGTEGITIYSGTTGEGTLQFADASTGAGTYVGQVNYNHSNNFMSFGINGAERMRIDSSGNVGIGTTTPSSFNSLADNLVVGTTSGENGITIASGTGNSGRFVFSDNTTSSAAAFVGAIEYAHSSDAMFFYTSGSQRMAINSSGNVGIGTSSPDTSGSRKTLQISNGTNGGAIFLNDLGTGSDNPRLVGGASGTSNLFIAAGGASGIIAFETGNATERMRITSGGQIWMRTTSTSLTNSTQVVFHPGSSEYGIRINSTGTSGTQYHLSFDRGETQAGYITSNSATTIAVNNASDERLKENIQNSNSAIQDLKDMQVRQFDWKNGIDTHRDFGFVAQELVNVVPEAVTQGTDELDENGKPVRTWGVDYSHIVPRLVKVCQEQQSKIEELEARITALETNNP